MIPVCAAVAAPAVVGEKPVAVPDASHVFGEYGIKAGPARLAVFIDPGFLSEAGWDPATRVLSLPPGRPLLGWRACPNGRVRQSALWPRTPVRACRRRDNEIAAVEDNEVHDDDLAAALNPRGVCQVEACPRDRVYRRYCRPTTGGCWSTAGPIRPSMSGPGSGSSPRLKNLGRSVCTASAIWRSCRFSTGFSCGPATG
ncbi:hypothetical protein [Planotetraspora sp. GP83]|uniref:hypothetical protein n=1 Tax=Planotetraspora sp. GP83 TaxID=3156264 RepID=UPI003512E3B3